MSEELNTNHRNRGGETPGARATIDRMVKQMVDSGTDRAHARKKAVEAAVKHDRRNR